MYSRWLSSVAASRRRPGFSLVELLVVMMALELFLAITAGLLWATVRIERTAAADFQRTLVQGALADQFRADVAAAEAAPEKLEEVSAGPRCLILRAADGTKVIYRWDGEQLERSATAGSATAQRLLPVGAEQAAVEFTRTGDGRLLTLRLTESHGAGSARRPHRVEITAALGGDGR